MADTGAPWFIPYVEPGDLVRDYPAASEALGTAIAAGLDDAYVIAQVTQTVKTDTFSTTANTYQSVTGLAVTITPSTNTAKILIIAQVNQGDHAQGSFVRITGGNASGYVGDADGSRVQSATYYSGASAANFQVNVGSQVICYLDSPATTSPVTYQVELRVGGTAAWNTAYINRTHIDSNSVIFGRVPSSITAIEVAA